MRARRNPRGLRSRFTWAFALAVAVALLAFSGAVLALLVLEARSDFRQHASGHAVVDDPYDDVWRVLAAMAVVLPVGVAGAALFGRMLAQRAVEPLREAGARASAARASELDLSLPVRGVGDEWDELAAVLNALLLDGRNALERIRRFTADAAHELRTPLTAIIGEADVALRRPRTAEELRASLEGIRSESERLGQLVEALLTLARADSKTLLSAAEETSLDEIAERVRARLGKAAAERGLRLSAEGRAGSVVGDPVLLARALGNVVDNALRHAREGVSVALSAADGSARVRVSDDGPGIAPELVDHVFERFVRGESSRSQEGFGLGLPLAKAIAEAHGGVLRLLDSERGACFELVIPSARPEAAGAGSGASVAV